ncbi:uridine kinase [Bacteroidia bacterium]|nr:uridine kinase [Bacteroidia bacterium]
MIDIIVQNTNTTHSVEFGAKLYQVVYELNIKLQEPIVAAIVNNELRELSYQLTKPVTVRFITIEHPLAKRMYQRSAIFVVDKAIRDLFPKAVLRVEHSLPSGYYCEVDNLGFEINARIAKQIDNQISKIVSEDKKFVRKTILTTEAIEIFKKRGHHHKVKMLETRKEIWTSVYSLDNEVNYFNGYLVPSTGLLPNIDFEFYGNGFLMKAKGLTRDMGFGKYDGSSKLYDIFTQYKLWLRVLGLSYVGELNELIVNNKAGEIIKVAEALQEKNIANIADMIHAKESVKMVLISGPSSSGKTTTSKRLGVQLQVLGYDPVVIAMDNYFVNREKTPLDENGEYDFESIEALDVKFFSKQMMDLMNGKEIDMPTYNFHKGCREFLGNKLKMKANSIIVTEGIHGMNPALTVSIPDELKFKIYASALTPLSIDPENPVLSTDNRFLRRIVRDNATRGVSAQDTILRWESVKRGENKNIFPFQGNADVIFNSALIYEINALKYKAEQLLRDVPQNSEAYAEAQMLLKFLSYFNPIKTKEIPPTSIIREFLGGSSFEY